MSKISDIQRCFQNDRIYYTGYAKFEMENEEFGLITDKEVFECIQAGQILESYSDDKPYPSFLIFGHTSNNRPLHRVCAYCQEDDLAIVVTVYHPDPELWIDYKIRRK